MTNLAVLLQRQRAIGAEEKESRRQAILDAAERLLIDQPSRLPNVAEVADEAGLAKGTVYLYFPSKEELLLALHERHVHVFFEAFFVALNGRRPLSVDDVVQFAKRYMVDPPAFLPLASLCLGTMEKALPPEVHLRFHLRIAQWVERAGAGLGRHFPALKRGQGASLLMHSYALIVGLWQMRKPDGLPAQFRGQPGLELFDRDYRADMETALRAMWRGQLGGNGAAARSRRAKSAPIRKRGSKR